MYELYKRDYMSKDGRIMDPKINNSTTSEGQAYMLMRSVASDDKQTFDLVYKWTEEHLKRQDNLFSWLWGMNTHGKNGIIDDNSASDADVDIAFALIIAYQNWHDDKYLIEAKKIISSIWNYEIKNIDGYNILMPGVIQACCKDKIEINPSYFSPYAFKLFQMYDKTNDWNSLVESSYYFLEKSMDKTATGLPPNWFLVQGNQIILEDSARSDFSYDAVRVFPRYYLDYIATGDKRTLAILQKSAFFISKWKEDGKLFVNYRSNGELRDKDRFIGSIAVLVPAISLSDKMVAFDIYTKEVLPYINNPTYWSIVPDYYGKNLLWFGCYLYGLDNAQ